MMKEHRASWSRSLGGAASIAILAGLGLAVATPGFAQEERQSGKVVVNDAGRAPLISKVDIARLREKCGRDGDGDRGAVICSGEEAKDPEVRAIMDRTMKRVERHVERVTKDAVDEVKIQASIDRAMAAVDRIGLDRDVRLGKLAEQRMHEQMARLNSPEHRRHMMQAIRPGPHPVVRVDVRVHEAHVIKSLQRARKQLASLDIDTITRAALRSSGRSAHALRIKMSPEDRAELEADLAEARRDAEEAVREAEQDRREALREADEERREALREAEEARREAIQEAREARRELAREMRDLRPFAAPRAIRAPRAAPAPRATPALRAPLAPPAPPAPPAPAA